MNGDKKRTQEISPEQAASLAAQGVKVVTRYFVSTRHLEAYLQAHLPAPQRQPLSG